MASDCRHFLVATGGSQLSKRAFEYTIKLARQNSDRITVVFVSSPDAAKLQTTQQPDYVLNDFQVLALKHHVRMLTLLRGR